MFGGMQRPGTSRSATPAASSDFELMVYQTALVRRVCRGMSRPMTSSSSPSGRRRRYPTTCSVTSTGPMPTRTPPG